jgi:hypothetical protein
LILNNSTFESINENFRDISSGWLWSSEPIYDQFYDTVYDQPISVESQTLLDLRWVSGTPATTITIRTDSFSNAPVIWAGYTELIQENIITVDTQIPAIRITPFKFIQSVPSNIWIINHELDKYPAFRVRITTTGLEGYSLEPTCRYINENTMELYWSQLYTGAVHLT